MFSNNIYQILSRALNIAWPITLQHSVITLMGLIDVVMVGHLGDKAIAAGGLSNRLLFVFVVLLAAVAEGSAILSAQYFGSKNHKEISKVLSRAILLHILLFSIIAVVLLTSSHFWISLATQDPEIISLSVSYLYYSIPGLFFLGITIIFDTGWRSIGETRLSLIFSLIGTFANIFFNYILIFGAWGLIEPMGVAGAALGTTLTRGLRIILVWTYLAWKKHILYIDASTIFGSCDVKSFVLYLKITYPLIINYSVWSIGVYVYQICYGLLGTDAIAAITMIWPIEGFLMGISIGLGSACSAMVGHALGAKDYDLAQNITRTFLIAGPATSIFLGFLLWLNSASILVAYNNVSQNTHDLALSVLQITSLGLWTRTLNFTLAVGILRTGGDTKFTLFCDIVAMWILAIPLTWLCASAQWPVAFVCLVTYSEEIVKGLMFIIRYNQKSWLNTLVPTNEQTYEGL